MAKYRTLKDLRDNIDALIKKNPQYAHLPIIYASDDEGNSYQKVHNELTPMEMENIDERNPEPVLREDEPRKDEVNCICIN